MGGGGKGGGSKNQTVTQKADPWAGIQPFLRDAAKDTDKLYDAGKLNFKYYPGQTIADQSNYTKQAIGMLANHALSPQAKGINNAAIGQVTDTLSGKYLDPRQNPGFQQAMDDTARAYSVGTSANTDSAFNRARAFGGSSYNEVKGIQEREFADSLNKTAGDIYNQERQKQLQAATLAPSVSQMPYQNIQALSNAGSAIDSRNQDVINDKIERFNFQQQAPANNIQNYINLLNGVGGGYSQTQQRTPYSTNGTANILGLGLGALGGGLGGAMNSIWGASGWTNPDTGAYMGGGSGLLGAASWLGNKLF